MSFVLSLQERNELETICKRIRVDVVTMLAKAGSGHPGGSLSCVELMTVLFEKILRRGPQMTDWNTRDHFHLSKGHVCPTLYALLAHQKYFDKKELDGLRQMGALLQGHPHITTPGVEACSGSLGQGLSVACGMALAGKLNKADYKVFVLLGDGELQEGQVWEAAMFAAHYKLDNLCVIVDNNGLQIDGKIEDILSPYPIDGKFAAFGFQVVTVADGHDVGAVYDAYRQVQEASAGKPQVIIAKTVKGKGVSFMEGNVGFHGKSTTTEETEQALKELGI